VADRPWRRDAAELVPLVRAGVCFEPAMTIGTVVVTRLASRVISVLMVTTTSTLRPVHHSIT
jgi:hypothetical protein